MKETVVFMGRLANLAFDDETLSADAIHGIEEALEDIKEGRLHSEKEIMEDFELL